MTCADNSHRKTFVKMFSLNTCTTKMTPHGCLALSIPPPPTLPSAASTTTTSVLKYDYQEQQQLLSNSNDPFNNYTNTFDLSLLPQDHQTIDFNQTFPPNHTTAATILPAVQNNFTYILEPITPVTPPEIKIEQQWPAFISTNDIKQEHSNPSYYGEGENNKNQLQVPLFSNGIYPSPQSSPAQTEYQLKPPTTSSTGSPLNAATVTVKEEQFHILPPSPPESSYSETPSPIPSSINGAPLSNDIKSEPFEADVEKLNDLSFLKIRESNNTNTNTNTSTNTASQQSVVLCGRNQSQQDYQVLREFLEDTTFQKKHNLKPLALDSIIGGIEEVPADIEPVIFLALQHVKREAEATCSRLQISHDPTLWSSKQAQAWLEATTQQFKLPLINNLHIKFPETGAALLQLSEEEFNRRVPECGSTLHAQLELWKLAYSDDYNKQQQQQQQQKDHNTYMATTRINTTITTTTTTTRDNQMEITVQEQRQQQQQQQQQQSQDIWNNTELTQANQQMEMQDESEDEECLLTNIAPNANTCISTTTPNDSLNNINESSLTTTTTITATATSSTTATSIVKRAGTRSGGSHIHLWQFLKELLATPQINGSVIRWLDRQKGIFKIEDSVRVAKLWGKRKNRPAMNYDKLSRSIRQYYKKGIMKKTERSQRLVYQFCQPYHK